MSLYLDTSVLVSLFAEDTHTPRAEALVREVSVEKIVSDLARLEFAAVIMRGWRSGRLSEAERDTVHSSFDAWPDATLICATPEDFATSLIFVRRAETVLRAPDALHLAITQRMSATLATFDVSMARAAALIGIPIAP